jgi:hypothetical protein
MKKGWKERRLEEMKRQDKGDRKGKKNTFEYTLGLIRKAWTRG